MKNLLLVFTLMMTSFAPTLAKENSNRSGDQELRVEKKRRDRRGNNNDRAQRRQQNRRDAQADRRRDQRREDRAQQRRRDQRRQDRAQQRRRDQRRQDRADQRRRDQRRQDRIDQRRRDRRNYRAYRHRPHRVVRNHTRRWERPNRYHRTIPRYDIYLNRWLRVSIGLANGYHWYNEYPYFVYNGYRHRYSPVDYCEYELVDSYTDTIYTSFSYQRCSRGYDQCADFRDDLNDMEWDNRYFCAEKYTF